MSLEGASGGHLVEHPPSLTTSNLDPTLKLERSKPCLVKLWKFSRMENPQLLWPVCSIALPQPMERIVLYNITAYLGLLPFCCVPLRRVWLYLLHNSHPSSGERLQRYLVSLSFLTLSKSNISVMCPRAIVMAFGWTLLSLFISL